MSEARSDGGGHLRQTVRAALRDPHQRRLQIAWAAINAGEFAFLVTNVVYAYDAGGPGGAGLFGLAAFLAPTLVAPFSGIPTARWHPERVLTAVTVIRALAVAAAVAVVAFDGPLALLLAVVAIEAGAGAFTRPLLLALLPALARSPAELVAANVASSVGEGIGSFAGPALGGLLVAVVGLAGANLAVLAAYAFAVLAIAGLHVPRSPRRAAVATGILGRLAAGARAIAGLRGPRLVTIGFIAQATVRGALFVLTVVAAIELLGMGSPGVGLLNGAFGLGGIAGAVAALALAGRPALAPWFALALAAWGAPIAVLGLGADPALALAMMVAVGAANAVLDVAGFTILQRTVPNAARVAVLGTFDSLANGGKAVGGAVAPLLLATLGIQGALVAIGLALPLVALLTWPGLRRVDDDVVIDAAALARIRADPLFAPLSMAVVEELAAQLRPVRFDAGASVIAEGERGDSYYLIVAGRAAVTQDGAALREVGPGSGVGEIALLRDVPRTATVHAVTELECLALGRIEFLDALAGHPASRQAADTIVADRLATQPAPGS